ncbi:MAG: hypothetical protein ABR514_09505 [Chthoniobacterales bacterium]
MKSLPRVPTQPWRIVALFCILVTAIAQVAIRGEPKPPRTKTVTITDEMIVLHPGTKLSRPDRKALNEILGTYNKSLYKIETYKDGQVTRTLGQLSDALIDKTVAAEAAESKASGNSNHTLQIIAAASSQELLAGTTAVEQPPQASPSASTNPLRPTSPVPSASTNPLRTTSPVPSTSTNPVRATTPVPSASTNPLRPTSPVPSASTNPQRPTSPVTPTPTPTPTGPNAPTNPVRPRGPADDKTAHELIERLKPILEKYSRK